MSSDTLCDPYIWQDAKTIPNAILSTWSQRKDGHCHSELTNTIVVWYGLAVVIGAIVYTIYGSAYPALLVLLTATFILIPVFLSYGKLQKPVADCPPKKKEGFTTFFQPVPSKTESTARNPFMNVLIDEIKYNPTRPPAANSSSLNNKLLLDDFFRVQFTSDPTDVFGKTQSQRQFITMPSTTVPNDQASYQDWLYKIPGKTCKEGGREACLPGTDGGKIPWLNVER